MTATSDWTRTAGTDAADASVAPARPAARRRHSAKEVAIIATIAVGFILLVETFLAPPAVWGGRDNPGAWHPPSSRAELLVAKMDGHTFAEIASDPTMAHTTDAYFGEEANAAYRSSRPLQGWVDWVASLGGQRALLAPVILVLTALAVGFALWSTAGLATQLDRRVRFLGVLMATPPFIAAVAYPGICEPLAIALALGGISAWLQKRPWLAVALLTAAGLTRETMLLVPVGLGLAHLFRTRRPWGALKLVIAPLAYQAWVLVVHARIGAWPSDYAQTGGVLVGFREGFPHWHPAEWAAALVIVASAVVIFRKGTDWMKAITLLHVPLLAVANYQVWWVWLGFGRVAMLLPIFALISLGDRLPRVTTSHTATPVPAT